MTRLSRRINQMDKNMIEKYQTVAERCINAARRHSTYDPTTVGELIILESDLFGLINAIHEYKRKTKGPELSRSGQL